MSSVSPSISPSVTVGITSVPFLLKMELWSTLFAQLRASSTWVRLGGASYWRCWKNFFHRLHGQLIMLPNLFFLFLKCPSLLESPSYDYLRCKTSRYMGILEVQNFNVKTYQSSEKLNPYNSTLPTYIVLNLKYELSNLYSF